MTSRAANRGLPVAFLLLAAVAAAGAYFRFASGAALPMDTAWRSTVILTQGSSPYDIAAVLAEVGSATGVAACGAIVAALLFAMRCRREAAMILTALIIGALCSELAKWLVMRPRPLDSVYIFSGSSYPSGHSMGAAALAVSIAFAFSSLRRTGHESVTASTVRWVRIGAICWTLAMMWSRTALGVHWLSDTLAGAALGVAAALIARRIWEPRRAIHTRAAGASAG